MSTTCAENCPPNNLSCPELQKTLITRLRPSGKGYNIPPSEPKAKAIPLKR